jgi:FkbM family methyltransferase
MKLHFRWGDEPFEFECFDSGVSKLTSEEVLKGESYPKVPFARDVRVVLDVGANCGAASVYFSRAYPDAQVFAVEPAAAAHALLVANTAGLPNVHPFHVGLHDHDAEVPLYSGAQGPGASSIHPSELTTDEVEPVQLRSARAWVAEQGIDRIDVLKVDTEGCEVAILEDLVDLLPGIQAIHLEYHSDDDRRALDRILAGTHVLGLGKMFLDIGEVSYVSKDLFPDGDRSRSTVQAMLFGSAAAAPVKAVPITPEEAADAARASRGPARPKVFGIGLGKTGTTSLAEAFEALGFRHAPPQVPLLLQYREGRIGEIVAEAEPWESFDDFPWPLVYRELAEAYPDARFVLTLRESPEAWIESLVAHAGRTGESVFKEIAYGYALPFGHEEHHLDLYRRHEADVRAFFADRPDRLLVVSWDAGGGWDELCDFLGLPVPDRPFPWANQDPENRSAQIGERRQYSQTQG